MAGKKQKDQSQAEFDRIVNEMNSGGSLGTQAGMTEGTPMTKSERDYFQGVNQRPSAVEAIRRARRANKQPPLRYGS